MSDNVVPLVVRLTLRVEGSYKHSMMRRERVGWNVLRSSFIQEQLIELAARLADGRVHSKLSAYIAYNALEKGSP